MPNHETRPAWLEAQEELGRLHALMVELEEHVEERERREFESCDACDTEFYLVRTRLDRHVELWAVTWAKQAAELHGQRELLVKSLQVIRVELSERLGINPPWDGWLSTQIHGIHKVLRAVGVAPHRS